MEVHRIVLSVPNASNALVHLFSDTNGSDQFHLLIFVIESDCEIQFAVIVCKAAFHKRFYGCK